MEDNDKIFAIVQDIANGNIPDTVPSELLTKAKDILNSGELKEEEWKHLATTYNLAIIFNKFHEQLNGYDAEFRIKALFLLLEIKNRNANINDVIEHGISEYGDIENNEYGTIIYSALEALNEWQALEEKARKENEQKKKQEEYLPIVRTGLPTEIKYPTDKLNSLIWIINRDEKEKRKEVTGVISTGASNAKEKATVEYGVFFDGLEGTVKGVSELTHYDKRVFIMICNLYRENGQYITVNQICAMMTGKKKPSKNQVEKVRSSIDKMMGINITIDNSKELEANSGYPSFVYRAKTHLLPIEILEVEEVSGRRHGGVKHGGQILSGIRILEEPLLMRFAEGRKQVTTIPIDVLVKVPLNQTEENLHLIDYLIGRVAAMKRPGSRLSHKILYTTMHDRLGIAGASKADIMARKRLADKVRACLDCFLSAGYIAGYTETAGCVTINP